MTRSLISARTLAALAVVAALAVPFVAAQERGEEIVGTITGVSGRNITVKHDDGREIRISVTPSTEVYFQDSGDRKLFPNPGIDDLRQGMGVRFNYNGGNPSRIVVHYVPAGFTRPGTRPTPEPETDSGPGFSGSQQIKARIKSVDRDGREITADVAGRERKFDVADRRETEGLGDGDMVVLTVEARGRRTVVTRIESADKTGTITRIAQGGRSVTIEVDGRQETYETQNSRMLDDYREGDRVRIEVEERSNGRHVITAIERRGRGRR